jgi:hydroxymethylglutaryl-CoA synthase
MLVNLQVRQTDMEDADGVPGKYTVGLGQAEMAVPSEHEDVISMALSACSQLLEKHSIDPRKVGRLEVGTESGVDRSKSVKTYLMQVCSGRFTFVV